MLFSSMTFLWIFLPIVLLLNYSFSFIKKEKVKFLCKNINLLIASLIFYAAVCFGDACFNSWKLSLCNLGR